MAMFMCKRILSPLFIRDSKRVLTRAYAAAGNDMEGTYVKTSLSRVRDEDGVDLQITSFDQYGFFINDKIRVIGPIVLFQKAIFSWNISGSSEINKNSLSLFAMLEPKLDVLVIGTGDKNTKVNPELPKWLIQNKINNFEILPTEKAINAFNFLVAENRYVAAALVPTIVEDNVNHDVIETLKRQELYDDDEEDKAKALPTDSQIKKAIDRASELDKKNKIESGESTKTQKK